jgi:hypothetical protein
MMKMSERRSGMKRSLSALLVGAVLSTSACTDSRGRIDPLGTGLLLGGVGLAGGLTGGAIARHNQPNPYRYGGTYGGRPYYRDNYVGSAPGCSYGTYLGGCN